MKRFLVLAVLLVLSLALPGFAAEDPLVKGYRGRSTPLPKGVNRN